MRRVSVYVAIAAAMGLCLTGTQAQEGQRLEVGPWTAEIGLMDLIGLSWQGEEIVKLAGVRGYLPGWEGTRFVAEGAEVAVIENAATWRRLDPGNQETTTRLELAPERAGYSLATTVWAAGPTEFWAQIVPDAVSAGEQFFLWAEGGRLRTLPVAEPFEKISGLTELRFERPDRTIVIRCDGFELQDRRASGAGLFLVDVIGAGGGGPTQASRTIEIEVRPAPAEQIDARAQMLAQLATEIAPMGVRNPGFEAEEPLNAWSENPLASADEEIVHSGERSARLTIEGEVEQRGHVYLTQMIPVEERHLYRAEAWIRGAGVEAVTQGGMGPVGATVIVEFADKSGAWFASGSYGPSNYETFDWRRVTTGTVRAPEDAGYAIIFLALRGVGTAWFDDIALQDVRHNVVLLEPLPATSVHDNTPTLDWHFNRETWAQVELSRDARFPEGATRTIAPVASPPITVEEPLEPGTWHWRVQVSEYDVTSAAWQFEQTALLDEDTTESEIAKRHDWLATPRAALRVRYSDNVRVGHVRLIVDGRDVSERLEVGESEARYAPDEAWGQGLHVAQVQVEDAAGNVADETLFFTRSEPVPRIVWRETGGVTVGGEPRFLLGMYGVAEEDMAEIAAGGFDFVHSYRWDGAGSTESALAYLDAAGRHGLRAFMGISRARLMAYDERFVAERVAALMDHPALLAWYLYDEPDLEHQYVSPMWLERYYRLIRSLDPFHPMVVTCARDGAVPRYRDALDVHWTQVYGSTGFVAQRLDRHRAVLREGTPAAVRDPALLRQGADKRSARRPGARPRDLPARRADHARQCLHGTGARQQLPGVVVVGIRRWRPVLHRRQRAAGVGVTAADGGGHPGAGAGADRRGRDRDVGTGPGRGSRGAPVGEAATGSRGDHCGQPRHAAVPGAVEPAVGAARQVRFEDRRVEVIDGELADDFAPQAVHVYQWPAP